MSRFAARAAIAALLLVPSAIVGAAEDVTVWGEKADAYDIEAFVDDFIEAETDLEKAAHVENLKIERDNATIHLVDGYVMLQEPVRGRSYSAMFAGVGKLYVEPPVPVERIRLKKYWGQETVDARFDRAEFYLADEIVTRIFTDLNYRPVSEIEEELAASEDDTDGADEEAGADEEDVDWPAWDGKDPKVTAKKAQGLFKGMLEELRKQQEKREKNPRSEKDLLRLKSSTFPRIQHMTAARKDLYGSSWNGGWAAEMRRVVSSDLAGSGQIYVKGLTYGETPHASFPGLDKEEIFLFLQTNMGNGFTELGAAWHHLDEYDPDYLYTATSQIIADEDPNEIRVTDVAVELTLDGQRADGRSVFTLRSNQEGAQLVYFDLLPTMGLESLRWIPPGKTEADAVDVRYYRPKNPSFSEAWTTDVHVYLPEPLAAGETATLVATYEGQVLEKIRSGFNVVFGRFNWFPDRSLSPVTLDAMMWYEPKRVVTATGNPQECPADRQKPGLKCTRWTAKDPPVRFATFNVASDVKIDETKAADGTPVRALAHNQVENEFCYRDQRGRPWCKSYNLSKSTEMIKNIAAASLDLYQEKFGEFPYTKLELVPWESGGAQAPATLVTLSWDAYLTSTAQNEIFTSILERIERSQTPSRVNFPNPWTWTEIVSHEVSHQWWGHIVFWNTNRDQWLSEGLADFSSAYFMEVYDKANNTDYARKEWQDRIEGLTREDQKGETVGPVALGHAMSSRLNPEGYENWSFFKLYRKGAYIAQMLRGIFRALAGDATTGDDAFFAMMKDFVESNRNGDATNLEFQKIAEKHLGGDLGWFFNQWLYNDGIPIIRWSYEWIPVGEKYKLKLRLVQTNTDFQFPISVTLKRGGKKKRETTGFYVMVPGREHTFETPAAFDRPWDEVTLNDDLMLLAEIEEPEPDLASLPEPSDEATGARVAAR